MSDLKTETIHGVKWTALNSIAGKVVSFLLSVVLARLLSPSDYGIVGMTAIFFALAQILVDSGLSTSLIRKKNISEEDSSTIFFFNIGVSTLCYILLFLFAPQISIFLNSEELIAIIRVSALSMVIGAFGSVHYTLMTKNCDFKTPTLIAFPTQVVSGVIGIILAYIGYGPWALVWQQLIWEILRTIAIWFHSSWRPRILFSSKSFKELFGFSGNIAINSLLDTFFQQGIGMLIGKYYTPKQLGYYTRGQQTAQFPSSFLFDTVGRVLLPVLSKIQDDDERLIYVYRKYLRMFSLVVFFCMILLVVIARPFVSFLFTEKWLPAVIFLQLFSLSMMFYHVHASNWTLLLVKGRSDWALKKEIINKTFKFIVILSAIPMGPIYICIALCLSSVFDLFVNAWVAGRLFDFGIKKQSADFLPYLILSIICCCPSYALSLIEINDFVLIVLQSILATVFYFGFLYFRKDENLSELIRLTPLKKIIVI